MGAVFSDFNMPLSLNRKTNAKCNYLWKSTASFIIVVKNMVGFFFGGGESLKLVKY